MASSKRKILFTDKPVKQRVVGKRLWASIRAFPRCVRPPFRCVYMASEKLWACAYNPRPVRLPVLFAMRALLLLLSFLAAFVSLPVVAGMNAGVLAFENEEFDLATKEFAPLAKAGNTKAMTYMGRILEEQDKPADALVWYLKAAQKGYAEAQTALGRLYDAGEGVARDEDQALAWYGKAAAQGDDDAQFALGEHAEDDLNDKKRAQQWYEKAAVQGNADAQYRLGLLLINDDPGFERDVPRAWMLLSLAEEGEIEEAAQARDVLELEMEPVELRAAQKMLQDWKKAH